MKKNFLFILTMIVISLSGKAQRPSFMENLSYYIENTAVFEWNQEDGRTYYIPKTNLSLNGNWRFLYADTPEEIPSNFYNENFNDRKWKNINVPSNWEMVGYGDKLFRNVHAPFKAKPPYVPKEYNPSGAYRREFTLPFDWNGQQIFLRFEKIASASFLWINGKEVGYNEGAQEPSEYNITSYLKKGKNTIAVLVLKYSDGYYLEGQDYWRLAGIFDDVYLYATPNIRIFDWQVITDLDINYQDANLKLNTTICNYENTQDRYFLRAQVLDKDLKEVALLQSESLQVGINEKKKISLSQDITNPAKWSSETPTLYTLKMQLLDANGKIVDSSEQRFGFKKTEIKGNTFYLNGVAIKVNAQNSHMQHPQMGHTMDEATIRKDFEILKQHNFNCVRISHYPPVPKYLDLADEYGLFIIDEAGVEAHATEFISNDSTFTNMYRERVYRMVMRDRNHPCILFWSAGNESGEGKNITEVIKEGKKYDPTRYWMYGGNAYAHPAEDIIGPRYPSPMELELQVGLDTLDKRPSFMDEYLSVAGNGCGGLDDYWRVIYDHPRSMGGAIWDFVSPGLTETVHRVLDASTNNTFACLMGNARVISDKNHSGKVLDLNGHDQWVEIYRQNNVEITGHKLTLTCDVYPRKLISSCGSFITKGSYQFGLQQIGKDSLDFYIYTDKIESQAKPANRMDFFRMMRQSNIGQCHHLHIKLPDKWEYNWHQLSGVYDGANMTVYIDGKAIGTKKVEGNIINFPFPINIGRNAEIHGQETNCYICDALIDNVGIFSEAVTPNHYNINQAALWLDFEKEEIGQDYFSYGIGARNYGSIWPNRIPQPEMAQMKHTVQPLSVSLLNAENSEIEIWNRNHFLNANHYLTHWYLQEDNDTIQQGILSLDIAPLSKKIIKVPYQKTIIKPGKEYRLLLSSTLRNDELWAKAGFEISWDQLELPWVVPLESTEGQSIAHYTENNNEITVNGKNFVYVFDKQIGALSSMIINGKQLLSTPIVLNVWRAPISNELDQWCSRNARSDNWKEGFGEMVATEYYSNGIDSLTRTPISFETKEVDGKVYIDIREIDFTRTSHRLQQLDIYVQGMASNGFENIYSFIINGDGNIKLHHRVYPGGTMPIWLPCIGLTFDLNKEFNQVHWYGRGPEENYPDRKTGYKIGIYKTDVDAMYEPYLTPQDYGLRTDTRWLQITNKDGVGLSIKMNELFNFSAHCYSTENLTKATYLYQLNKQNATTVNIDYATTGVGCSARSVLPSYRVKPTAYERRIDIIPLIK